MSMKTAGVIVICEKSLKCEKSDPASKFLIQELNLLNYNVAKVIAVPENESVIVNELDTLIKNVDIIIVVCERCSTIFKTISGMISQELKPSEELIKILEEMKISYDNEEIHLPVQAKLMHGNHVYPVIHLQRIFILNEKYMKHSFDRLLKNHLAEYRKPQHFTKTAYISQNGNLISDVNDIKKISIKGVVAELSKNDHSFIFNFSSSQLSDMIEFENKIRSKFESYRLKFVDDSNVWESVFSSEEKHVKNAIEIIERSLQEYGLENVFLSFNGGKDCTVLLHLVLTVVKKKYPHHNEPLFCLYVQSEEPFPEQEVFINQARDYYNLQITTIRSGIKEALQETLEKHPNYKACFMGTRRTDPYSGDLNVFQMTDSNWPQIMRVSPLLDWHYSDIWDYLLYYKVPYCSLYDLGYTSLGNTVNTTRNPSLIYFDECSGKEGYLPAYKLLKETKERHGRNVR